ncbi:MAG: putative bifunctional diguanylate cyclase/phosphodiesterase [Acidimicrobiales bacterium]
MAEASERVRDRDADGLRADGSRYDEGHGMRLGNMGNGNGYLDIQRSTHVGGPAGAANGKHISSEYGHPDTSDASDASDVSDASDASDVKITPDAIPAHLSASADPVDMEHGIPASTLIETALDTFVEVDGEGVVLEWNGRAEEMFGWERKEVLGRHVQDLIVPSRYRSAYNEAVLADAARMASRGRNEIAMRNFVLQKKDGSEVTVLSRAYAVRDGEAIRIGGFIRDVSDLRAMEEKLAAAHLRDHLTGLPNRAYLTYQLNYALVRNAAKANSDLEIAVVAVDMDRFTAINDAYGQEVGDEVLIAASKRLSALVDSNTLLGRFGADEFFACFDGAEAVRMAEDFAEKAIEAFSNPIDTAKGELYVGVSVGIGTAEAGGSFGASRNAATTVEASEYGFTEVDKGAGDTGMGDHAVSDSVNALSHVTAAKDDGMAGKGVPADGAVPAVDASILFSSADAAMQNAKKSGLKSYVVFGEKMREEIVDRVDTQMALHRAIEMDELRLFYQPVVDIKGQAMMGVEALIRWEHPARGLVAPDRFIPVAEDSGLIIPIGKWVLEKACDSFALWDSPAWRWSETQTVSVNLSARQVDHPGLVRTVEEILDSSKVVPERVTLEITESALMKDAASALSVMRALKSLGVALSIDDFGTGYSSLSYLQRFPLDILKIDKSFIDELGINGESTHFVKAIIDLAHALKLEVVAEGVETELQLEMLQSLGCDLIQGFLFSKPMPTGRLVEEFSLPIATPPHPATN